MSRFFLITKTIFYASKVEMSVNNVSSSQIRGSPDPTAIPTNTSINVSLHHRSLDTFLEIWNLWDRRMSTGSTRGPLLPMRKCILTGSMVIQDSR